MSYVSFPSISSSPWKSLDCLIGTTKPDPYLSFSLHSYLCKIKEKISDCGDDWDTYKKYTNPKIHMPLLHCHLPEQVGRGVNSNMV